MSDESFFREVSEELRQDRVKALWTRFGMYILGLVVLIIVATVAFVGWDRYTTYRSNVSGDRYLEALRVAEEGETDAALEALRQIVTDGHGAYPDLARMSIGGILASSDRSQEAVAAFDEVADDSSVPQTIRDTAALRSAYILVDTGSLDDVRSRVERLTGDSEPMRFPAREVVGLAAWKAGETETARSLFQGLLDDESTPAGIASRARLMLDLIAGSAAAPAAEPSAAGDAAQPASGGPVSNSSGAAAPSPEAPAEPAEPDAENSANAVNAPEGAVPSATGGSVPSSQAGSGQPGSEQTGSDVPNTSSGSR